MYFANKRFLVQAERAETDGFIDYGETVQPYFTGNMILTDEYGNQSVVTENAFYENYIGVRKLHKTKTKSKSPFELAYAEQLANFSLENNVEDNDYIQGTRNLISNKPL